jgi:hypothetical protein
VCGWVGAEDAEVGGWVRGWFGAVDAEVDGWVGGWEQ